MSILRTIAMFIYLFGYMILHYGILRRAGTDKRRPEERPSGKRPISHHASIHESPRAPALRPRM